MEMIRGRKSLTWVGNMDTPDIMKTTDLVTSQPTIVNDPVNRGHKAINNKACEEDQPAMVDECS